MAPASVALYSRMLFIMTFSARVLTLSLCC